MISGPINIANRWENSEIYDYFWGSAITADINSTGNM